MTSDVQPRPVAVPRVIVKLIWKTHRLANALTGGRFGLRMPGSTWGMLRLTTLGRRTGRTRVAIVGYLDDGVNLAVPAMNGWADPEPAWWLNLQASPDATVVLPTGERRAVRARAAAPDERRQLWRRFLDLGSSAFTDEYAALRSRETAIVVLEPRRAS